MTPGKSLIKRLLKTFVAVALLSFSASFFGCGDSSSQTAQTAETTGTATAPKIQPVNINHTGPLSIEVIDNKNDIITSNEHELTKAPAFVDINWVDIAKEGDTLKFSMELNANVPETSEAGKAAEWGFLLDTNQDGSPDWGVFASVDTTKGWYYALNNMKTNEKMALTAFPGKFSQGGTNITWTLNPGAPAMADSFKWMAYANYYAKSTSGGAPVSASDTIPDFAPLDKSGDWPPFP